MKQKLIILAIAVSLGGCVSTRAPSQDGSSQSTSYDVAPYRLIPNPKSHPAREPSPHYRVLKFERVGDNFYRLVQ